MLPKKYTQTGLEHGPPIDKPRKKQCIPSIIAEGIEIVGDLTAETEIQVDGTVRGNLKADHVIIGRTGLVEGSIEAERATIDGTVSGDTIAKTAALEANAQIMGGVMVSGDLTIVAGARLDGKLTNKLARSCGAHAADKMPSAARPNDRNKRGSNQANIDPRVA